jgi:hypothetical protein
MYARRNRLQRWQASSKIRRQADRRKASKWEMYAGSNRLQRWQASSKIRRQADRRKECKWEMYAGSDRLKINNHRCSHHTFEFKTFLEN